MKMRKYLFQERPANVTLFAHRSDRIAATYSGGREPETALSGQQYLCVSRGTQAFCWVSSLLNCCYEMAWNEVVDKGS